MRKVPDGDESDVNRAVAAARAAFDGGAWPATTAQERGRILFRLAEKIRKESVHLAELEARNSGKPIVEAGVRHRGRGDVFRVLRGDGDEGGGARESGAGQRA